MARAQGATLEGGQMQEAFATLNRAFDYYAEVRDVDRAVAVAEHQFQGPPGILASAVQLLARALELVPPDSHEAGRLLCRYGLVQGRETGDYERTQEAFSRALTIAQREGDVALEMWTLVNAANVDRFHNRYQESLGKSLRVIELARLTADLRAEVDAHYWAGGNLTTMGDLEQAKLHAAAMLNLARRLRARYWLAGAFFRNATVSYLEGEWMTARDYADQGLSTSYMDHRLLGIRAMLEYQVGEFGQGEAHLERLIGLTSPWPTGDYFYTAMFIPQISHISGEVGRLDVAETAAEAVLSEPSFTPFFSTSARMGLALIAVQRGDVAAAEEQYAVLDSVQSCVLQTGLAGDHFEDALTICRNGFLPELAWTCCDYADALLQRNDPGDREKAMSLLDESLPISSELGMRPLMERVLSRREILGA